MDRKKTVNITITACIWLILGSCFLSEEIVKAFNQGFTVGTISATICMVLFMLIICKLVPRLTSYLICGDEKLEPAPAGITSTLKTDADSGDDAQPSKNTSEAATGVTVLRLNNTTPRHVAWLRIALYVIIIHLAVYVTAHISAVLFRGFEGSIRDSFSMIWKNAGTDAPHYLGLAQNWYVTEGDPMYHIVFFPFFPILIKLFQFVVRDYLAAAILVSISCSVGVGITAFELAKLDYSEKTAFRFVKYIFILPAAFFYSAPMSESAFVFVSLLCLYFSKKRKFWLAAIFGAMASFARSPGVLLMFPVGVEYFRMLIETYKNPQTRPKFWYKLIGNGICVAAISFGMLGYIYINYAVWGNPFQFTIFQREHWSQQLGFFFSTAKYHTNLFIDTLPRVIAQPEDLFMFKWLILIHGFAVVCLLSSLAIVLCAAKKLKPLYVVYFLAYYAFTMGTTWLLSAPRYLMASVTLPLALALITDTRWKDITATVTSASLALTFLAFYGAGSPIY